MLHDSSYSGEWSFQNENQSIILWWFQPSRLPMSWKPNILPNQPWLLPLLSSVPEGRESCGLLPRLNQKQSHLTVFTLGIFFAWNALSINWYTTCMFAALGPHSYIISLEISSLKNTSKMPILLLLYPVYYSFTLLHVFLLSPYHSVTFYYLYICLKVYQCLPYYKVNSTEAGTLFYLPLSPEFLKKVLIFSACQ